MAKFVVTATTMTLATVSYSAQIAEASLQVDAAEGDITNMASAGWNEIIGGLKSAKLSIDFKKDADLSGLDAAMYAALGTVIAFTLKQTAAATSATNPVYSGSVLVNSWQPIGGKVGDVFSGSVTFPVTGAITRATS